MSECLPLPPAILLMGPTASGKSALAVELATALDGEIISVDSALVYRGMDIGTAKPSLDERGGIPHHLIDILDPAESFSTGQFRTLALNLIDAITRRKKIPILAGGTMLYFNALTQGLAALPEADPEIRARLDRDLHRLGSAALHQRLQAIDAEAAARIHPNDPQRIQRALEVFEVSGRTLSSFFGETQAETIPFRPIKLIIAPEERATLHGIIAERFRSMLRDGLIEEVDVLYRRGDLNEKMPSIRAVGYRQAWAYLAGEYDYGTMTEKGIVATRQLAKRQFTWLRRETDVLRYHTGQSGLLRQALADIQRQLT
ncbi:tRNA (adenosine(37)-N6)-dimethylallyltransferase MiaA [Methylomicrobium sp. Wu6]|uniref:tRNA (adenosine(37)-N6)-dimethylallyltransferase MiaA n=1 Tax=Methylomicrobium sp. Wu6 TaxID=3107928 RepID=UPI002DD64F62|nr:tRNA (adenosine(37)-N6)-dimethylallyltransferase MiaA [Methylomicrobium sp. Wu6]MEC4748710.1 tRNA (adenosine(37)-N6)-dimethylallyltransferase MiaA [Methylomicrobium sp. Wu6]